MLCAGSALASINQFTPVGPTGGGVERVAFHPINPKIVYAANWGGFSRSTDGGSTWQLVSDAMLNTLQDLAVNPTKPDVVIGVGSQSVWASTDGGASMHEVKSFPRINGLQQEVEYSVDGSVVYVAAGNYVVRSTDDGQSWTQGGAINFNGNGVIAMAVDPANAQHVLVSAGAAGYQSSDGGANWAPVNFPAFVQDIAIAPSSTPRVWIATSFGASYSDDFGAHWTTSSTSPGQMMIRIDPANPNVIYAGGQFPLERSTNNGGQWLSVHSTRTGLIQSLAIDPQDSAHLILAGAEGISGSTDGGAHWNQQNSGIFAASLTHLQYSASTDRVYAQQLYGAPIAIAGDTGAVTELNYDTLMQHGNGLYVTIRGLCMFQGAQDQLWAQNSRGMSRSLDGGASWSLIQQVPLGIGEITGASADGQSLLGISSGMLYRSTDSGDHWDAVPDLPGMYFDGIFARSASNPSVVYVSGILNGGPYSTLLRSSDGGAKWSAVSSLPNIGVWSVTVDPTTEKTIYVGSADKLYKSTDEGGSWSPILWTGTVDNSTNTVAVDPTNPSIIYASGPHIARSIDGGAHWQRISSPDKIIDWARELLVDPKRPATIYAATDGRSLRSITIQQDLELTATAPAQPVTRGSAAVYQYHLKNLGPFDASRVRLSVQLPVGSTATLTSTAATCSANGATASCDIPALLLNQTVNVSVTVTQLTTGTFSLTANAKADQTDLAESNNSLESTMIVAEPPAPPIGGGGNGGGSNGGGGGGSDSLVAIAILAAIRAAQNRSVRRQLLASIRKREGRCSCYGTD
ncbi:MAG: VPS10 domain-containing protein, partial [Povalibacter sp.]